MYLAILALTAQLHTLSAAPGFFDGRFTEPIVCPSSGYGAVFVYKVLDVPYSLAEIWLDSSHFTKSHSFALANSSYYFLVGTVHALQPTSWVKTGSELNRVLEYQESARGFETDIVEHQKATFFADGVVIQNRLTSPETFNDKFKLSTLYCLKKQADNRTLLKMYFNMEVNTNAGANKNRSRFEDLQRHYLNAQKFLIENYNTNWKNRFVSSFHYTEHPKVSKPIEDIMETQSAQEVKLKKRVDTTKVTKEVEETKKYEVNYFLLTICTIAAVSLIGNAIQLFILVTCYYRNRENHLYVPISPPESISPRYVSPVKILDGSEFSFLHSSECAYAVPIPKEIRHNDSICV